jgi:hypothetical protein
VPGKGRWKLSARAEEAKVCSRYVATAAAVIVEATTGSSSGGRGTASEMREIAEHEQKAGTIRIEVGGTRGLDVKAEVERGTHRRVEASEEWFRVRCTGRAV